MIYSVKMKNLRKICRIRMHLVKENDRVAHHQVGFLLWNKKIKTIKGIKRRRVVRFLTNEGNRFWTFSRGWYLVLATVTFISHLCHLILPQWRPRSNFLCIHLIKDLMVLLKNLHALFVKMIFTIKKIFVFFSVYITIIWHVLRSGWELKMNAQLVSLDNRFEDILLFNYWT